MNSVYSLVCKRKYILQEDRIPASRMRLLKSFLLLLPLSMIFTACNRKGKAMEDASANREKLPNIVYILADDLGYGDIGAFNPDGKIPTPNIDRLAAEGMRFTDAHSPSAVCTPTRYGILTGRYAWRSGLKEGVLTGKSKALIPEGRSTVASLLKTEGYRTAFIGKWHLGWDWALADSTDFGGSGWNAGDFDNIVFTEPVENTPNDLGFNYAYGHSGSLDMAPYVYVENAQVTAEVDTITENKDKYSWWRKGPTASDFDHEQVTPHFFSKAADYLRQSSEHEVPFFLYLALPSPHTPILPTEAWQGESGINPYADFVMMIDDYVGQLVETLAARGLADNTMIVFTSDNGCSPEADFDILAEKGHHPSAGFRGHKADIFEGGHRIPFIVKWPGRISPNTISNLTVCQTDLMATCADIIGKSLEESEGEDSFSMLPLFANSDKVEYGRKATVHHSVNGSFAIRQGNWKLIFCPGSGGWSDPKPGTEAVKALPEYQLYNLSEDPFESSNLVDKHPDKVKALRDLIASYIKNGRSTPGEPQQNDTLDLNGKGWEQISTIVSVR